LVVAAVVVVVVVPSKDFTHYSSVILRNIIKPAISAMEIVNRYGTRLSENNIDMVM
jgi:hypothetical protein